MSYYVKPVFSFIIPTYHRADIICEALESIVLEQKNSGFVLEVLIADDFSNDTTETVIANWCKTQNIHWVHYEKLARKAGVCAARNNGVDRASGEYLIFLDSDDQMLPGSLRHIKAVFENQPEVDLYYGAIHKKSGVPGVLPQAQAMERVLDYPQYLSLQGVGEYLQVCRSSLLRNPALRFNEQINGFETWLWMWVLREGAKLWIDPRPVRLYDDLRTDRLCHPQNLAKDAARLATGFRLFFTEFSTSIEQVEPQYWNALLFRAIFYSKASGTWNRQLKQRLQNDINKATFKVRLLTETPGFCVRMAYPLINKLRGSAWLKK